MKTKTIHKQEKPKWFTGAWYTTGDTVTNPFSGECYTLTGPELSMYDFIQGAQYTIEIHMQQTGEFCVEDPIVTKLINDQRKGIDWFRSENPKAYMVLLD